MRDYVYWCTWVILLKFQVTYPNLTFRSSIFCQILAVQFLRHKCSYYTIIELTRVSSPARASSPHGKPHPVRAFRCRRPSWTPQAFWLGWVSPVYIPTTVPERLFLKDWETERQIFYFDRREAEEDPHHSLTIREFTHITPLHISSPKWKWPLVTGILDLEEGGLRTRTNRSL